MRRREVPLLGVVPATQDLVAAELELVDADDRAVRLRDALRAAASRAMTTSCSIARRRSGSSR